MEDRPATLVQPELIRTMAPKAANAVAGVRGTRHVRYAVTGAARLIGLSAAPPEPSKGSAGGPRVGADPAASSKGKDNHVPNPDLHPAAERMSHLLSALPDDAMDAPTPCPDLPVGALIDHVGGFAKVFTASARKEIGDLTAQPPDPRAGNLEPGWRDRVAADLAALADAWNAPEAWDGMTQAGGQDLPAAMAGRIALDELVIHGWDIAQATGQPFDCDAAALTEVESTVQQVRGGNDGELPGLFGPVVPISGDTSNLDRALSLTGRDPAWSPK